MLEVDLSSVFRLCRAAGRHMIERGQGGKIINVASLLSFQGGITVPGYAAAKGGVVQLTKALANEWASHGINVNAIAPGYMETDNTAALRADAVRNRQITERIPAGRWGTPEDSGRRRDLPGIAGIGLRERARSGRRRRLDGPLRGRTVMRVLDTDCHGRRIGAGRPLRLRAQDYRGALQGRIVDDEPGRAARRAVTLTNVATGVAVDRVTDAEGRYLFDFVEPGTYTDHRRAPGLQDSASSGTSASSSAATSPSI